MLYQTIGRSNAGMIMEDGGGQRTTDDGRWTETVVDEVIDDDAVLHSQYLQLLVERDRHPLRLPRRPLQRVDLRLGVVREDRLGDRLRHRGEVPYQRLRVITARTYMTARVRRPRDRVDGLRVTAQLGYGHGRRANVEDHHLIPLHQKGREVVVIVFVPTQSKKRNELGRFVDDGGVFERSQVEHADGSVGTGAGEYVGRRCEGDVVHLLIVRDQLCLRLTGFDVPDRADQR